MLLVPALLVLATTPTPNVLMVVAVLADLVLPVVALARWVVVPALPVLVAQRVRAGQGLPVAQVAPAVLDVPVLLRLAVPHAPVVAAPDSVGVPVVAVEAAVALPEPSARAEGSPRRASPARKSAPRWTTWPHRPSVVWLSLVAMVRPSSACLVVHRLLTSPIALMPSPRRW